MSRQISISDTITLHPTGYDSSKSNTSYTNNSYPISNGYTDATSTTEARIYGSRTSTASVFYTFDSPNLSTTAVITSVTGQVRNRVSSTSQSTTARFQLYAGTSSKGSLTTRNSTSTATTSLTPGSSWTASEINNLQLMVGLSTTSTSSNSRYLRFYGATVSISYSITTTAYTLNATSTVSGASITPTTTEVYAGDTATFRIDTASLDDIAITDNNNDILSNLVRHDNETITATATFIPSSFDETNSVYDHTVGNDGVYSTNYIENGLTDASSTTRCALYSVRSDGTNSKMYYNFDCSDIPANAIINSVSCSLKAGSQGSTYYDSYRAYLTSGTTIKTNAVTVDGSNGSPSTETISGGSWTRAELDDIKVLFQVTANDNTEDSTWSFYGATLSVSYTIPADNPYYWTYDLTNMDDDHVILIEEAGVYIPPEEDPEETYWPITISSINATTDPPNGTTRVIEGTNQTITITPTDPQLTLALDNGVDITSQLVGSIPVNTSSVTTQVSGASYGFTLNNGTGYYVSNNTGQSSSAAVCRLNFDFEVACLVTISYINYAEATYDYGIFGAIDTALGTTYSADSGAYHTCNSSSDNTSAVQTLTYNVPAGTHFVDIKYRKDNYTDSNNDNLQWKLDNIEALEGGEYTYTLTNITAKHSLIFVFGDVVFYYITSSGSSSLKLFPDGQQVKLEGDSYTLNIVPPTTSTSIAITDNGTNVTSNLEREDGYDKDNNPVVSYRYKLTNITANHTLVITAGGSVTQLYVKENGTWVTYSKAYKKINGSWVEQSDLTSVFSTTANYVHKT